MEGKERRNKNLLAFFLTFLFLFGAFGFYLFLSSSLHKPLPTPNPKREDKLNPPLETFNILVVGIDQRDKEKSRADTIMVYRVDLKTNSIKLLSIPRDTYVNIPGRGKDKINHAHAFGDMPLLLQTVEEFLGIKLDYYLRFNFEGFKDLVDAIGGVQVDVEKKIAWSDIKPGLQTLDGEEALAYVRDRNDQMGDVARVERQQKFIMALAQSLASYKEKERLLSFLPKLYSCVKTNLSITKAKALLPILAKSDLEELKVIPGRFTELEGISYWEPNEKETQIMVREVFGGKAK